MDLSTELELVENARRGLEGFSRIYEYYYPRVFNYCLHRTMSKEVAEDITGETFLAAVSQLYDFDTSKGIRFGAWLYRVAHNKIIDSRRRYKFIPVDIEKINLKDANSMNQEAVMRKFELQTQVTVVMADLKPRYQEILSYQYYGELTNPEIAALLDLKISQVNVLIHRSLQAFKKHYAKKFPQSEIFDLN